MNRRPFAPSCLLLLAMLISGGATQAMSAAGSLSFANDGEAASAVNGALIDPVHGFAYFGSDDAIVKVDLATFRRVASIALAPTDAPIGVDNGVIDLAHGFAYFGTRGDSTVPGKLLKLDLAQFKLVGEIVPTTAFPHLIACTAIDTARQFAYVGVGMSIYQVNLQTFQLTSAVATLASGEQPFSAVVDPTQGTLYVGSRLGTGAGIIQFTAGAAGISRVASAAVAAGEGVGQVQIDPQAGYLYATGGGLSISQKVAQVRLSPFARVAGLDIAASLQGYPQTTAYDPVNKKLYVGSGGGNATARILKLGVGAAGFSTEGQLAVALDDQGFISSAIDPAAGRLYLATTNNPTRIQRVDIGSTFALSGSISFGIRVVGFESAQIDAANGFAYFLTETDRGIYPSTIVKVRLADFSLSQEAILPLEDQATCWASDAANGFLYIGTSGAISTATTPAIPARILKYRMSDLALVGSVTLPSDEILLVNAGIDVAHHVAYFLSDFHKRIVEIDIGSTFARLGAIQLTVLDYADAMVVDAAHRTAYVHQNTTVREIDLVAGMATGRSATLSGAIRSIVLDPQSGSLVIFAGASVFKLAEATMAIQTATAPTSCTFIVGVPDGNGMAYVGLHSWDGHVSKGLVGLLRLSDLTLQQTLTLTSRALISDSNDELFRALAIDPAAGMGYAGSDSASNGVIYRFALGAVANQPPTITAGPTATPPVNGTSSLLSVTASDDGGEANLTYTWSASGPAAVVFSANGTNAAKSAVATFSKAGAYTIQVTVRDAGGLTATGSVAVTVLQMLTSVAVAPASASVTVGTTQPFSATAKDQFGAALAAQPAFIWTVSGGGTISGAGLFTAGATAGGPFVVTAASGAKQGTASVTVTAVNHAPTVASGAAASPNPVAGTTTALSVLGADDGGEAGLTYTWSSTGPAAVGFSANGTNAAKNATATFSKAGSYAFTATIRDAGGLTVTSSVTVTVNQRFSTLAVSPATASVTVGGTQQFSATAKDQFGTALSAQPATTWTVNGGGTVDGLGQFTAGAVPGGPFAVTTAAGGVHGGAQVSVTAVAVSQPAGSAGSGGSSCGLGAGIGLLAMLALFARRSR